MERSVELEAKFDADPGFEPDLTGVATVGQTRHLTLEATYFDTPDRQLDAAGWSLRRRAGGVDDGWHLKRPHADGPGRVEVHAEPSKELPAALRAEAGEVIGTAPLVPVAELTTVRTETALLVDDVVAGWLARDEVSAREVGGRSAAALELAWLELEVELLPGVDASLLAQLSAAILAGGARPAGHASKAARVLAATGKSLAEDHGPSAGAVLLAYAGRQVGILQAMDAGVRVDAPDAVHKSRVATRRLRSLLRTFADFWDAETATGLREELSWLAGLLGDPRDAEVLAEEFGDLFAELGPDTLDPAVPRRVLTHLSAEHDRGHGVLVAALATPRAAALRDALMQLLVEPPLTERAQAPSSELTGALERAIGRVERLRERALRRPGRLERWHDVRKAAKAVRYCTEALADVEGGNFAERAAAWEAVTEAFGTLQDALVATELLTALAESDPDGRDEAWAVLLDIQSDRASTALAQGRGVLSAALANRRAQSSGEA